MSENKKSDVAPLIAASALMVVIAINKYQFEILGVYFKYRLLVCFLLAIPVTAFIYFLRAKIFKSTPALDLQKSVTSEAHDGDSVLVGVSDKGRKVYLKHQYRRMHSQVIGTTNAGKTESVIIPWAVDDIKKGRGLIIIDGKSDRSLLDKVYAYAWRHGRKNDVRILSICDVGISHSFNPFVGGSPLEITERIFAALTFENEYYKSLQYETLLQTLIIFDACKIIPTPMRVIEFLRSPAQIDFLSVKSKLNPQIDWATQFLKLTPDVREQRMSGFLGQLQAFSVGETACLFNVEKPEIDLEAALEKNHIIYCQLPALRIPTLGQAAGKLILQSLQSAISSRHLGKSANKTFFSAYLDDFTEYLTPGFVTTLNKSRSANVAITFAHQAIGDLGALGESVKNSILTNANLKVIMRSNDPDTAEYFSGVIGTTGTAKITERQKMHLMGAQKTGEGSVREAEEYKIHPNKFKQDMGLGEAVLVIPHEGGSLPVEVSLFKLPDIDLTQIETFNKARPTGLLPVPVKENTNTHPAPDVPVSADESASKEIKFNGFQETQEERTA